MEFNDSKNKNLTMLNSPYLVEYSQNVAKSLEIASTKDLFDLYNIKPDVINDYKNHRKPIPLWIVEATCNINDNDWKIPIIYQNLWFCLHGTVLTRMQPSGRTFRTKVQFAPCYLDYDDEIYQLITIACKKIGIPKYKFSSLCGYRNKHIKTDNKTVRLTAVLKACQIMNLNVWNFLQRRMLYGMTNHTGAIIIPKNKQDVGITILLVWLKTEDHLELGSTHLEINQKDDKKSLESLRKLFIEKFGLKRINKEFCLGSRGENRLIISSSPLRQLLVLKYGFTPGYKTGTIKSLDLSSFTENEYKRIIPAFIQTEGCLSYNYTRNKKKKLPKFEFIVYDKNLAIDCYNMIVKLGYSPSFSEKQNIYKVTLSNSKQVVELVKKTEPYFFNKKKIHYLRGVCTDGIGL